MQIFVAVQNFPSYLIGDRGEVISLNYRHTGKAKKLKRSVNRYGYENVELWKNGEGKRVTVHQLVAQHFVPNPNDKPQVDHLNGDKTDNRAKNLEWVAAEENIRRFWKDNKQQRRDRSGEKNHASKVTKGEAERIKMLYEETEATQSDIATRFDLNQSQVSRIVNGKRWNHLSQDS